MATALFFTLDDLRTQDEYDEFDAPMPLVSAALKRIMSAEELHDACRLLPIIAKTLGKGKLQLSDIIFMGGGCLLDKYVLAEKVMKELTGGTAAAGKAAGLDVTLLVNPLKWRQLLIQLHRECVAVEKEDREERAGILDMGAQLEAFEKVYYFKPEQKQYSTDMFGKAIFKAGLDFKMDNRTDWRRASPASGRRDIAEAADGKKVALASLAKLQSGGDVRQCVMRKLFTIMLIHGDADISSFGFTTKHYGSRGSKVCWLTLADVKAFERSTADMEKLSHAAAAAEADWLEKHLAELIERPALMTLACALGQLLPAFESRLNVAAGLAATTRLIEKKRPGGEPSRELSKLEKKKAKQLAKAEAKTKNKGALLAAPGGDDKAKLKRMKGGNPAGPPCRNFKAGKCSGPCRFSHEKDDDLADIDDDAAAAEDDDAEDPADP